MRHASLTKQQSQFAPDRYGNFDLLLLLSTQAAIHRVLRKANDNRSSPSAAGFKFFRNFYLERVHYFDGDQRYGRADEFLEELLLTPPSVSKEPGGRISMIDPLRTAEIIVNMRGEICQEWSDSLSNIAVDHTCIRKEILEKRFGSS